MIGDEDDDDATHGAESEGTEGQDDGAEGDGGQKADLSAEQPEHEEDDGEPEAVAPSRGSSRIQRLANEAKAAKEEAAAANRRIQELERQTWQQNSQVTEQQERERLALMTPDERADYRISQMERKFDQRAQQQQMQTAATMDKVAYDAKATINPVYAKLRNVVEERFQEQLRLGKPVEREILLKLELGERALAGAAAGTGAARKSGRARVDSQRVASGSGKGDAASERGKSGDSPENRLKDVYI